MDPNRYTCTVTTINRMHDNDDEQRDALSDISLCLAFVRFKLEALELEERRHIDSKKEKSE